VSEVSSRPRPFRRIWRAGGALPGEFGLGLGGSCRRGCRPLHFRTDTDDAIRAEVAHASFGRRSNIARDFLGPELGVAGADLNSSMWIEV